MKNSEQTFHTYESNRIELHDTKEQGNVTRTIKNIESVATVEREIFELLREYKGEAATFYYWFAGHRYVANYTKTELSTIFN